MYKGGCKGGCNGWEPGCVAQWQSGELLWSAISEAAAGVMHLEKEWDSNKLEKKLREYFNKGAKQMTFGGRKTLQELVDEYADTSFSSIFSGLGDREWLYTGQADFLLVLDSGIKEHFPAQMIMQVPQADFEQLVLSAHDRAFEEQRFYPVLADASANAVQGPKTKRKVYNAVEQGRKEAAHGQGVACASENPMGLESLEDFTSRWIDRTIAALSSVSDGWPDSIIPLAQSSSMFQEMISKNAIPLALTQEVGAPPEPWSFIDAAVKISYANYGNGKMPRPGGAGAAAAGPYGAVAARGTGAYGAVGQMGKGAYGPAGGMGMDMGMGMDGMMEGGWGGMMGGMGGKGCKGKGGCKGGWGMGW